MLQIRLRSAQELEAKLDAAFSALVDAEWRMWNTGRVRAALYVENADQEPTRTHGRLSQLVRFVSGDFVVSYTLSSADWPDLELAMRELELVISATDGAVTSYLEKRQ